MYDAEKGVYRKTNSRLGISDIIGYQKGTGRFIAVEIKTGKDTLSIYQSVFLQEIERHGGIAIVARNFEQFFDEIKKINQ